MTDPTRTTGATMTRDAETDRHIAHYASCSGATVEQINDALDRAWDALPQRCADRRRGFPVFAYRKTLGCEFAVSHLVPPDQCIVPRAFIEAVDAAISEAEELDYTTPAFRIPLGKWHDVENARDTFREGK